jgi:hypothetical protein
MRSFRGVQECAWFERGDLEPFVVMLRRSTVKAVRRAPADA